MFYNIFLEFYKQRNLDNEQGSFVQFLALPSLSACINNVAHYFHSVPSYSQWKEETPNSNKVKPRILYSPANMNYNDAVCFFKNIELYAIPFESKDQSDADSLHVAFSKRKTEERKYWLSSFMRKDQNHLDKASFESFISQERNATIQLFDNNSITVSAFVDDYLR